MIAMTNPAGEPVLVSSNAAARVLHGRGYRYADEVTLPPAAAVDERPTEKDSKADWVAYATAQGIEDAEEMTKAELIDATAPSEDD